MQRFLRPAGRAASNQLICLGALQSGRAYSLQWRTRHRRSPVLAAKRLSRFLIDSILFEAPPISSDFVRSKSGARSSRTEMAVQGEQFILFAVVGVLFTAPLQMDHISTAD